MGKPRQSRRSITNPAGKNGGAGVDSAGTVWPKKNYFVAGLVPSRPLPCQTRLTQTSRIRRTNWNQPVLLLLILLSGFDRKRVLASA
jgi:hypothetical protein